jgi:hypothetical protein
MDARAMAARESSTKDRTPDMVMKTGCNGGIDGISERSFDWNEERSDRTLRQEIQMICGRVDDVDGFAIWLNKASKIVCQRKYWR